MTFLFINISSFNENIFQNRMFKNLIQISYSICIPSCMEYVKHLMPGKVVDPVTQQYKEIWEYSKISNTVHLSQKKVQAKKKEKEPIKYFYAFARSINSRFIAYWIKVKATLKQKGQKNKLKEMFFPLTLFKCFIFE